MDVTSLDRSVQAAARALAKERASTQPDLDRVWTLHRNAARKTLYDEVAAAGLPREVKDGLLAWIAVLTVARVTASSEEALAKASLEIVAPMRVQPARLVSWREGWRSLVLAKDRAQAAAALAAVCEIAPKLAPLARDLRSARREALSFLEGAGALLGADDAERATQLARQTLDSTAELSRDLLKQARRKEPEPWPLARDVLLATDSPEGWPRLSRRWLEELFGAHTRGLSLDLPPLPVAVGGASYARVLGSFGEAFRRAIAPPSAVARPPRFVDAHRFGGAFAALAASPAFHRRKLLLSRRVADAQSRSIARALLVSLRLECAAWLSGAGALELSELGVVVFGEELPKQLSGAWPTLREDAAARLLGWLSAERFAARLREVHDEDWFDNPRAWTDLRGPAPVPTLEQDAPLRIARAFEDRLA